MLRLRSEWSIGGLPLIDVAIKDRRNENERPGRAHGVIAVGDFAMGGLAIGRIAQGLVSIGGVSLGGVSIGGISMGLVALGGIAVGGLALGGVAVGLKTRGGVAIGRQARGGAVISRQGILPPQSHQPGLNGQAHVPARRGHRAEHFIRRFLRQVVGKHHGLFR